MDQKPSDKGEVASLGVGVGVGSLQLADVLTVKLKHPETQCLLGASDLEGEQSFIPEKLLTS